MTVIDQLKQHELDQLEQWYDYEDKTTKKFLKEIVKFAKTNEPELKEYCAGIIPTEFSSLSIVYEALSEYSTSYNQLLFEEIKRLITLAKEQKFKPEYLEVLSDIETEDIYSKDEETYIAILEFMISKLALTDPSEFTVQLLDVIDWFLIDLDEDDQIMESKNWYTQIELFANQGDTKVKLKAREVLKDKDWDASLTSISVFDKLKSLFK